MSNIQTIITKSKKEIKIFDDFISHHTRSDTHKFIKNSFFKSSGSDSGYAEDIGEYNLYASYNQNDLDNCPLLLSEEILPILEHIKNHNISQARANLSTLNDKNHFHTDGKGQTLLYYANMKWNAEWGGLTLFANDDITEIEYASFYKPGRVIIFDGSIPHCISPPTNLAPNYRYSFVLQYYD